MKVFQRILPLLLLAVLSMRAEVNRAVGIQAPAEAAAGSMVSVTIHASTDARDGEQIGFLHVEGSIDEGRTWNKLYYGEKVGAEVSREVSFAVSAQGAKALVRVRAAFRGGAAGDVDYQGGAIQWSDTWQNWRWPPSKYAVINVSPPPPGPPGVNRMIRIEAPAAAAPGSTVEVTVSARTNIRDGEQIGFLHAEFSVDEGKTWTQICYAEKAGAELSRKISFKASPQEGRALVRVRAAFRGGAAGDVDYQGGAIQWGDSWPKWRAPVAKYAIIRVTKSAPVAIPVAVAPARPQVVKRTMRIDAPAEADAGSMVVVTVSASTDARDGEQIGFLHADYSTDEGKTWTLICYAEKAGAELSQPVNFTLNARGGRAIVRVRAAFRGGTAGDVDYQGGAIQWGDSWQNWRSPVTKYAFIYPSKS